MNSYERLLVIIIIITNRCKDTDSHCHRAYFFCAVSYPDTNLNKSFSELLYDLLVLLSKSLDVAQRVREFRKT